MKEEAQDFLSEDTLKDLIKKYSQFINFPIYVWESKVPLLLLTHAHKQHAYFLKILLHLIFILLKCMQATPF